MSEALARAWYREHPALWLLAPLSLLYALIILLRRACYRAGLLRSCRVDVPVVVVGNIAVGGTGKSPLTLALIERLRIAGFRPGVVSRGYGGRAVYPLRVQADTSPALAGDEPVMIVRRSGVPLVVDPVRSRAVRHLLAQGGCDVVLCDDGLQHYALARDVEIAVIDGARGVGNGLLLPAGPLREPAGRLATVDFVVVNGDDGMWPGATRMQLVPGPWRALGEEGGMLPSPGSRLHAVAGIGNPGRFFAALAAQGYDVIPHPFPDHHVYTAADLAFDDGLPVVMTEKDMVKCRDLPLRNCWYVPVSAALPESFYEALLTRLRAVKRTSAHAG